MKRLVLLLLIAAILLLVSVLALASAKPSSGTTSDTFSSESLPTNDTDHKYNEVTTQMDPEDAASLLEMVNALIGQVFLKEEHANEVKVGIICVFIEDEKQSVPYRWRYLISDESLISVSCDIVIDTSAPDVMPGGDSAYRNIDFIALAPGECVLTLRYGLHGAVDWDEEFFHEQIYHVVIVE